MGLKKRIQVIQDSYAQLLEQFIILIDGEKRMETTPSLPPHTKYNEETLQQILGYLPDLQEIKSTIYLDFLPGLKVMVSPIKVEKQAPLYLVGGVLVDEATVEEVGNYLSQNELGIELDSFLIESQDGKEKKLSTFHQLSETIQSLYQSHHDLELYKKKIDDTIRMTEGVTNKRFSLDLLLQPFKEGNPQLDFIGLVTLDDNQNFVIRYFLGEQADTLAGKEIHVGEGFLGQSIVIGKPSYWADIEGDPRGLYFKQNGLTPVSLFCHPIKIDEKINGLLFGGSTREAIPFDSDMLHIMSALIGICLKQQVLEDGRSNHLLQLATFNEIFHVMTNVQDVKRVLYILIDMGMNILTGTFACIAYRETEEEKKLSVISRGVNDDSVTNYCRDLGRRYFARGEKQIAIKGSFHELEEDKLVYEIPIMYRSQLFGVLSIGVRNEEEVDPLIPFLTSLAVAGGISIFLLQKENKPKDDEKVLHLLAVLLEKHQPEQYRNSVKAVELVQQFGNDIRLPMSTMDALKNACYLYYYDQDIVQSSVNDQETRELMRQFFYCKNREELLDGLENESVKLLMIVFFHLGEIAGPTFKQKLSQDPLFLQFEKWISKSLIVESEINLGDEVHWDRDEAGTEVDSVKDKLNLSNREMDVLELVLKGHNNREIATSLFISDHTVKNHMTNILQKLGVTDRSQAIAKVYQMGYIPK